MTAVSTQTTAVWYMTCYGPPQLMPYELSSTTRQSCQIANRTTQARPRPLDRERTTRPRPLMAASAQPPDLGEARRKRRQPTNPNAVLAAPGPEGPDDTTVLGELLLLARIFGPRRPTAGYVCVPVVEYLALLNFAQRTLDL